MARYIDADKLIEEYKRAIDEEWNKKTAPSSWSMAWENVIEDLEEAPTADVVELKHGEWVLRRQSNGVRTHQCSVCGRPIYTIDEDLKDYAPYCHCGAKMDGRSDT